MPPSHLKRPTTSVFSQAPFLRKDSYVPLYIQLRDLVQEHIDSRRLRAGDKLPSENELSARFRISRMTVRHAIHELERAGFVTVKKGEGTFVRNAVATQMLFKPDGFSTEMRTLGYRVRSQVLEASRTEYAKRYRRAWTGLGEGEDRPLVRIKRVRFCNDRAFALETSFLHYVTASELLSMHFREDFSLYHFIETRHRIRLRRAEHIIEPRLPDQKTAALLGITPREPVLSVTGTTFSSRGKAVEFLQGWYRGDQYKLEIEIRKG